MLIQRNGETFSSSMLCVGAKMMRQQAVNRSKGEAKEKKIYGEIEAKRRDERKKGFGKK